MQLFFFNPTVKGQEKKDGCMCFKVNRTIKKQVKTQILKQILMTITEWRLMRLQREFKCTMKYKIK